MICRLPDLVNANGALVRRGRFLTTTFLLGVGDVDWLIGIERGRIAAATPGPHLMRSWTFAIRAPEHVWAGFWQPMPRPGRHDIFAMTKTGEAAIEGDLQPLMANLRYIKEVLAAPRGIA